MRLFRHVVKHLYVYKRVLHPKKSGKKFHLKNKDKLNIKRKTYILRNDGQRIYRNKIKIDCKLNVSTSIIRRHLVNVGMTYRNI